MTVISKVSYSGLKARIGREDKLNEKLCDEAKETTKRFTEKSKEQITTEDRKNAVSHKTLLKEGVSYEKTIYDSASIGFSFLQSIEKRFSGTRFFVGNVSYGQTYGTSSDTNFVINSYFLERLGTDEAARKQLEEDVKYLYEFSQRFRTQQLAQGREIVNQGWFCDENGNWGGWSISRPIDAKSILQDMTDEREKIRQQKLEEKRMAEEELNEYFGERFLSFWVKWSEEEIKKEEIAEMEETEEETEKESSSMSVSVGVNVGKTARKIAAAKTKDQLRMVISEIRNDMQVVKDGMEKGWCDEAEMAKVEMLMSMAQNRMGEVEDREATPEEENLFAMASLM